MRSAIHREAEASEGRGTLPFLGYGVGLRRPHFDEIFDHRDQVDFLEVLSENFMGYGGRPRSVLARAAEAFPIVLHSVAMSIAGLAPFDEDYLDGYARLARTCGALWASDHLCFSGGHGVTYHDLIPVPFTAESLDHVVERIGYVQSRLPIPFAIENPSYYVSYGHGEMSEAEFLTEVVTRADCGLLLDVNNVYVNSQNHGYDPHAFIDALPLDRVLQLHMAGHHDRGSVIIDTHGAPVIDPVMDLFGHVLRRTGPVSTVLEWDHDIPELAVLLAQNSAIRSAGHAVCGEVKPWGP
ncbi:MAG: DUF692 domain-containing protein [Myxococcota bacterium]|nr:DUF692 domain-containing protein [Myxococcota bacterium]